MDSTLSSLPPLNIPALLRAHGLHPKKGLGQNFLIDSTALQQIVEAAEISPSDAVLEVGPGLGSLTRHLAASARQVVAVELDGSLVGVLEDVLGGSSNVRIIQGDILKLDPVALMRESISPNVGDYLVVANIPYYITSAVIRHLLEAPLRPTRLVLTVQREVAERITAQPGEMSLLALSVQVYGRPRIAVRVPAGAFYPPPKVDSSAVRVDVYSQPLIPADQFDLFFRLAKAGFGQKRKTLRNSLSAGLSWPAEQAAALLQSAGIDPQRRAETLSMEEWSILTTAYQQKSRG